MRRLRIQWGMWCMCWVSTCLLSACHTPLYRAAERGDAEAVRQLLAAGKNAQEGASEWNKLWQYPAELAVFPLDALFVVATMGQVDVPLLSDRIDSFGEKTPAEVAWQRGHTDVLALLAGDGVAIAPESMRGRSLLLQEDWYGSDGEATDAAVLAEVGDENVADCFVRYWREDDDWVKHRSVYLKHCVWDDVDTRGRVVLHPVGRRRERMRIESPEMLCYRRTGVRSAEVTMRGFSSVAVASKYELNFETRGSGTYRHLYAESSGVVRRFAGRFWVR